MNKTYKTAQRGKAMEKRKHIIFFIVFSIAVFLSVGVLGIQKSTVLSESAPHFNGSELKYQTGIFDIVSEIILFFYAALWLASAVLYALSSQNKTVKKIIVVPCILLLGTVTLFIAALLYMTGIKPLSCYLQRECIPLMQKLRFIFLITMTMLIALVSSVPKRCCRAANMMYFTGTMPFRSAIITEYMMKTITPFIIM